MAGKKSEPVFVNVYGAQGSIPPAYVAWRAVMTNRVFVPSFKHNRSFKVFLNQALKYIIYEGENS
jgi:hypothetical protein